jgi:hypothetical protein
VLVAYVGHISSPEDSPLAAQAPKGWKLHAVCCVLAGSPTEAVDHDGDAANHPIVP